MRIAEIVSKDGLPTCTVSHSGMCYGNHDGMLCAATLSIVSFKIVNIFLDKKKRNLKPAGLSRRTC